MADECLDVTTSMTDAAARLRYRLSPWASAFFVKNGFQAFQTLSFPILSIVLARTNARLQRYSPDPQNNPNSNQRQPHIKPDHPHAESRMRLYPVRIASRERGDSDQRDQEVPRDPVNRVEAGSFSAVRRGKVMCECAGERLNHLRAAVRQSDTRLKENGAHHPNQGHESQLCMQALEMRAVVLVLVVDDCAGPDGKKGKRESDEENLVLFPCFFFES